MKTLTVILFGTLAVAGFVYYELTKPQLEGETELRSRDESTPIVTLNIVVSGGGLYSRQGHPFSLAVSSPCES